MKLIKYILFFIVSLSLFAHSQSLKFVRTDVEKARENFVTATYIFGLDVYADSINNCTGVTFELSHNLPEYLKLSDWSYGDFGEKGSAVVIHNIDTLTKQGRLYVGVLSGEPVGFTGLNNPKLIHLEFAVSQSAPHGSELVFDVINSKAVTYDGLAGKINDIYVPSFKFKVHGFTDVWPGDADNNGVVDTRDIATVGLYLGYGLSKDNFRSFKRENPSTYWTRQRALCWDSLEVTYADCDGNGDVNITDMLIVPLNFGKVADNPDNTNKPIPIVESSYANCNYSDYKKKPILAYIPETIIGLAAKIQWKETKNQFICIEENNLFGSEQFFFTKELENLYISEFLISSTSKSIINQGYSVLAWVRSDFFVTDENLFDLIDAQGITPDGRIVPLKLITSADDNGVLLHDNKNLLASDGYLAISNLKEEFPLIVEVFDLMGNLLKRESIIQSAGQIKIDVSILASGYYYTLIRNYNSTNLIKFLKI